MTQKKYFKILCEDFQGEITDTVSEEISALARLFEIQDKLIYECDKKGTYQESPKSGYALVAPWFSNLMSVRKTLLAQMKDMGYRKDHAVKVVKGNGLLND